MKTIVGVGTAVESYILTRYDTSGRQTAEMQQVAAGTSVEWSDTEKSFIVSGSNPVQRIPTKLYEYDSEGRLSAVELPAVPDPSNGNSLTRPRYEYGYNEQGNQTLIRDPLDRETRFAFDAQGRQLDRTLPLGFGTDGILGTADDLPPLPPGEGWGEGYFKELIEYDNRGRQTLHISFEGVVTQNIYDDTLLNGFATGRLIEKRFFQDEATYNKGTGIPDEVWTYQHDAFGRIVAVHSVNGASSRTVQNMYDAQGRLIEVDSPEGTISYEYDNLGRHIRTYAGSESSPDQDTRYLYDALGRMDAVEVHAEGGQAVTPAEATDYVYDLIGNLDQVRSPNGAIADYDYDDLNRLELLRHFKDDNASGSYEAGVDTLLAEFDYDLRADGKRIGVSEIDDQGNSTRIDWAYDDIGRLTRESYDSHDDSHDFIADYLFDLTGNRIEKQTDVDPTFSGSPTFDETIGYLYDANDRLLAETKDTPGTTDDRHTVYEYGTNATSSYGGDHTTRTSKTVYQGLDDQGAKLESIDFAYNLQNRLSQSDIDSNGDGVTDSTIIYECDADGLRVAKTEDGQTLFYLVDHHNPTGYAQVLAEYNAVQQLQRTFTLALDILRQAESSGPTYHFLYDGHGSTRALLNALGNIVPGQVFAYDAYGLPIGYDPATAFTTHQYSGEQYDAGIGHGYNRARYYDLATGTWNRVDPFFGVLTDPQSLHKNLYVHGDPVNNADPSGLVVGGLVGLVSSVYTGTKARAGQAAAAFNTLRSVKSAADLYSGVKALAVLLNTAHDAINVMATIWDVLNFDPSDIADIKRQIESVLNVQATPNVGPAPISSPKIEIDLPVKMRGKLKYLFGAADKASGSKLSETLGLVGAVAASKAMGMRVLDVPVGYHGFDALMYEKMSNRLAVFEAKGGGSTLARGTAHGDQMSGRWIRHNLEKLSKKARGSDIGLLEDHMREIAAGLNGAWAVVVKTQVKSGEVTMHMRVRTYSQLSAINTDWGKPFD